MKSKAPALDKKVFTKAVVFLLASCLAPEKGYCPPPLGSRGMQRGFRPENRAPGKAGDPPFTGLFQEPQFR